MIEIKHEYGQLDIAAGQEIAIEENSKLSDANIINLDFSQTITLPYSPDNIAAFHRYGYEKFRCQLYSDGLLIGEFSARFREHIQHINTFDGSYSLQLDSIYQSLLDDMEKTKLSTTLESIVYTINPSAEEVEEGSGETKIHHWISRYQNLLNPPFPFRFPEYALINDYKEGFPTPDYIEDTLQVEFGKWVPVNHFNNQYKTLPEISPANPTAPGASPAFPNRYVEYNILYDRFNSMLEDMVYPYIEVSGGSGALAYSHIYPNAPQPRRIWSLACPCFPYLWVLEKALNYFGYTLEIEWDSTDHKALYDKLLILNNYNIFDLIIHRYEGHTAYYPSIFAFFEIAEKHTYWVGINASSPTAFNYSIQEWTTYQVAAKNHVPDMSVKALIDDFVAKTNMEAVIDGVKIIFRKPETIQDSEKRQFTPAIKTIPNEYQRNKNLKYTYEDQDREDNIPDYKIIDDQTDADDIESPIVPVYIHEEDTGGILARFPFICADPAIDNVKNKAYNHIVEETVKFYENSISFATLPTSDTLQEQDYDITICPPFCGVFIETYVRAYVGMYYFYNNIQLNGIAAPYHQNGRTLKWQDSTGIFENCYKKYLDILKAKLVHTFSEVYRPHSFQRFSHYRFFSFLGRKVYALKRSYKLPFSKNPLINYEGYESDE